jgi:hypothetical protein
MPVGCWQVHQDTDRVVGSPLCPACYDYPGHALFNAKASALWGNFTDLVYLRLGTVGGLTRKQVRSSLRVSFAKVSEYQARGVVHFHALIRLDGPSGPVDDPPPWADASVLRVACESAAETASAAVPFTEAIGEREVQFGRQLLGREVRMEGGREGAEKVAAYLAKYVTKGTEEAHGVPRRIKSRDEFGFSSTTPRVRNLMYACWDLGGVPALADLGLRRWCHMLGFPGHVATKSVSYSIPYKVLREVRAAFKRAGLGFDPDGVLVESNWGYGWRGYSVGLGELAAGIAEKRAFNRELAQDARDEARAAGEDW